MTEPQMLVSYSDPMSRRTFLHARGRERWPDAGWSAAGAGPVRQLDDLSAQGARTDAEVRWHPRYGILSAPAHFDVHQSGTVSNMAVQGPMYDNLIRRHPLDCQTIIPDLAQSWEIAPDGKTYTFFLRQGVQFHDGADFTATMCMPRSRV